MSTYPRLDPRWEIIRIGADGEADRLSAAFTLGNLNLHLTAFRVVQDGVDQRACNPDDVQELDDLYLLDAVQELDDLYLLDADDLFETATIEGLPGTWIVYATPSKR